MPRSDSTHHSPTALSLRSSCLSCEEINIPLPFSAGGRAPRSALSSPAWRALNDETTLPNVSFEMRQFAATSFANSEDKTRLFNYLCFCGETAGGLTTRSFLGLVCSPFFLFIEPWKVTFKSALQGCQNTCLHKEWIPCNLVKGVLFNKNWKHVKVYVRLLEYTYTQNVKLTILWSLLSCFIKRTQQRNNSYLCHSVSLWDMKHNK